MAVVDKSVVDEAILLVRIGEGEQETALHSGIGRFARDGVVYYGMGGLLSVEEINNRSGLESTQFRISLSRATADLQQAILKAEVRDLPVRVGLLLRAGSEEQYIRLKQGQVSNSYVDTNSLGIEVYTPMTDLTRVKGLATQLTREHQREFVDATDSCCDYIAADAIKEVTWP